LRWGNLQNPMQKVNPAMLPELAYTVAEVAQILKVSEKSVNRLVDRGLLKASNALRHLRITRSSLEEFVNGGGAQ
jgi:excisionase family DNA binding protein